MNFKGKNNKPSDVDTELDYLDDLGLDDGVTNKDTNPDDDLFKDGDTGLDDWGMDDMGDGPSPMDKHSDLLKGLTTFSRHIRKLYNSWLGITWDEEKGKFLPNPNLVPIINLKGANWCVSFIETYVRDNNILAHLGEDEYHSLLRDINRTLLFSFADNYEHFGFRTNSDVIRVWNEVDNASLLAVSGAGGGKYSDFLGGRGGVIQYRGSYNEQAGVPQQVMMQGQQRRKGLMERARGWLVGNNRYR